MSRSTSRVPFGVARLQGSSSLSHVLPYMVSRPPRRTFTVPYAMWVPHQRQGGGDAPERPPAVPPAVSASLPGTGSTPSKRASATTETTSKESTPAGKRLSATEQLKLLREAQAASQMQLQRTGTNPTIGADPNTPREFRGHRTVDVRMYDQLAASRNRMSQNLSKAKMYINALEDKLEEKEDQMTLLKQELDKVYTEMITVNRMSTAAQAAVQFAVDKEEAVEAIEKLCMRLKIMEEAAEQQAKELDKLVVREVDVEYSCTGAEVRIMGSFDNWTMGVQLSSDNISECVFQTFYTKMRLTPGEYRVKFLVDDEWRTAGDWPTVMDEDGNSENILVVE